MPIQELQTYTARWIFPVDAPPLERGTISVRDGIITAVEPHGKRTPDVDFGNAAILPGFVNAHTHLDLTGAAACRPSASTEFTQWLRSVIAFRRSRTPEQVQADIAAGIVECLRFGTTLIGDIAAGGANWRLLSQAKCRSMVFFELLGLTEERSMKSWEAALAWIFGRRRSEKCNLSFSPHAPYSVRTALYSFLGEGRSPIMTHLAESRAELELLRDRSGPLVDFLTEMEVWDPSGLVADPFEVIEALPEGIFVHGNYLDPATPLTRRQSLVICPRTHSAFGHPRHPFPAMLKRGVRVALGTDSLASNPDLDILAEARFLRQHYREVEPAALLRMLTLTGAEVLGFDPITGSLTVGKSADLVVLPLPNEDCHDPHDLVLDSTLPIRQSVVHLS